MKGITRTAAILCVFLTVVTFFAPARASEGEGADNEVRILILGNSLSEGLQEHLRSIVKSKKKSCFINSYCPGGSTLSEKYTEYVLGLIAKDDYDFVMLQEYGSRLDNNSVNIVKKFDEKIRESGARTVLFAPYLGYSEEMQRQSQESYESTARELGAIIIPGGTAAASWVGAHSDVPLVIENDFHPNPSGWYFLSCVVYSVFFGESPEGAGSKFFSKNYQSTLGNMQRFAWDYIKDFSNKDNEDKVPAVSEIKETDYTTLYVGSALLALLLVLVIIAVVVRARRRREKA